MNRIESVKKEVYISNFYTDNELIDLIETIKTEKLELALTLVFIFDGINPMVFFYTKKYCNKLKEFIVKKKILWYKIN